MDFIDINDQQKPFRFSFIALKKLCAKAKCKLSDLDKALNDPEHIVNMLYIGFTEGHKYTNEKIDFTREDVEKWIDEDFSLLQKATDIFSKSMSSGK